MKISNTLFAGVLTLLAVSVASIEAEIGTKLVAQNDLKPVRALKSKTGYHPSPSNDDWRKPSKPTCTGGPAKKGCNSSPSRRSPSKGYDSNPSNDDWSDDDWSPSNDDWKKPSKPTCTGGPAKKGCNSSPSGRSPSKGQRPDDDDDWSDDDWSPSGPSKGRRRRKCVCKTDDWKKTDDKCVGGPAKKGCNTATSRTGKGKGKYTRALKSKKYSGSKYVIDSYRPRRHCTCTPVDDDDWGRKGKSKKGKKGKGKGKKGKKGKGKGKKGKKGKGKKGKGKGRDDDWSDDDWSPSGPSKGSKGSDDDWSDDDWSDDHTDDWSDDHTDDWSDDGDDWHPTPSKCVGGPAKKGCNSPSKSGGKKSSKSKTTQTDDDWSDDHTDDWSDDEDDDWHPTPTKCVGGPAKKGCNSPSKSGGKKSKTTRRRRAI